MLTLIEMAIEVFYSFCLVFIMCELGERLIHACNAIDDVISQLDWYLFPSNIQKVWPIIIVNSQKPICIPIFGRMNTSREAFQRVSCNSKEKKTKTYLSIK